MDSLTIFVILLCLVAGAWGWRKGIIAQIGQLVAGVLAIVACRIFADPISRILIGQDTPGTDIVLYKVLTYVIIFAGVYIAVSITGRMLRGMLGIVHIGVLDHLAGAVFKITIWMVGLSLVLNLWTAIFHETSLASSPVFPRVLAFAPTLLGSETAEYLYQNISTLMN